MGWEQAGKDRRRSVIRGVQHPDGSRNPELTPATPSTLGMCLCEEEEYGMG